MNVMQKRFILFLLGCIGTRSLFVLVSKEATPLVLQILGYIALLPAIGFTLIYLFNLRQTGQEVFGEKIWWNHLRPLHALLYFLFAYMAINKNTNAWIVLLIDVMVGLFSFLIHHFMAGNFSQLF